MTKEVLLLNPPTDLRRSHGIAGQFQTKNEPMGLAYIAAYLEREGMSVSLVDAYADELGMDEVLARVGLENPLIVGISCLTPNAPVVYEIAGAIRKRFPKVVLVMGNVHPNIFRRETLEAGLADFIVEGEGEATMTELVRAVADRKPLDKVLGIHYREDGRVVSTGKRPLITDIDSLPLPARHLLPMEKYRFFSTARLRERGAAMLATRGCPFHCTFCTTGNMGKAYRKRSPKLICDEMELLVDRYRVQQVAFFDAAFPLDKKHGLAVCKEIVTRGLQRKMVWVTETRVNAMDDELAVAMRDAGCGLVSFGIEAGVQVLLDNIRKNFSLEQVRTAVRAAARAGMRTMGFFMLGLPGETVRLSQQTVDFAKSLPLDYASFNLTVPYPGSELYETLVRDGKLPQRDWRDYSSYTTFSSGDPVYVPDGMTKQELMAVQKSAIRQFYVRPGMIWRQLFELRQIRLSDYVGGFKMLFHKLGQS
jgi:anaerobic magnesium-protoporphyrin IX monomethyl ester cyclase